MSRAGLGLGVARTLALGIGVLALGGLVDAPADPARPVLAAAVALVAAVACEVAGRMLQDAARRRIARDLRLRLLADPASQALPEEGDVADLAVDGAVSHATYRAEFRGGILAALVAPLVVLALVALAVDGPLAGWLLVCLVAAVLLVGGLQRLTARSTGGWRHREASLAITFLQSLQGLRTLALFGAGERRLTRLARAAERQRAEIMRLLAVNQTLILLLDAGFYAAVLAAGTGLAMARSRVGAITPGQGVAVVLLTVVMSAPLDVIGKFFYLRAQGRRAGQALAAAGVAQTPATPADAAARPWGAGSAHPGPILARLDQATVATPEGRVRLAPVDLILQQGDRIAISGPSGIGKSTLLALLAGRLQPTAGRVERAPGLVTRTVVQNPVILSGTVRDNLLLGLAPGAEEEEDFDTRVERALAAVRLDGLIRDRGGLDLPLGERGAGLSGGQRHRLALARALLTDPDLLLIDEPTSGLDGAVADEIVDTIAGLPDRLTVIVVTHDPARFGRRMPLCRLDAHGLHDVAEETRR